MSKQNLGISTVREREGRVYLFFPEGGVCVCRRSMFLFVSFFFFPFLQNFQAKEKLELR